MKALNLGDLWALNRPRKLVCVFATFSIQSNLAFFHKRLAGLYLYEEILSGYEEGVSYIRDGISAWVKTEPETILP